MRIINFMNIGQRVTLARDKAGMTKAALARAIGMSKQAVGQIENGGTNAPTPENLFKIAKAIRVSPEWLATGKGDMVLRGSKQDINGDLPGKVTVSAYSIDNADISGVSTRRVPVINNKQAIAWNLDSPVDREEIKWHEYYSERGKGAYGLIMPDNKMTANNGRSIPAGAVVIIDPYREAIEGSVVAVSVNNDVIIKELVYDGSNRYLRSFNQHYSPILINSDYKIIGVAIDFSITSSLL